mgnify:FL=1
MFNLLYNMTKYLIFCFLISFSFNATLTGKVSDSKNSDTLIGASIYLEDTELGTNSDLDGNYIIFDVPIGDYKVIVQYIGYEKFTKNISIDKDIKIVENFNLKPSSIEAEAERIVGLIERKDKITSAPATKEVISSEAISIQSSANLGSYLKGLKGVDYTASGIDSYSISVRGFNSSFSSRLLTLTDGRVANIPALRVVSYNTIPQSQDDIEKMEVILGPATALYGANAHSGVVNIVSKPPSLSEGFNLHFSGTGDDRELRKINGRYAKKISDHISFKISGSYLHAYEWEYMSEREWKSHQFAWVSNPYRAKDEADNNPWNEAINVPAGQVSDWATIKQIIQSDSQGWNIDEYWEDFNGDGIYQQNEFIGNDPNQMSAWDDRVKYKIIDGEIIVIGNGEQCDLCVDQDGDGVAGEDWLNGYDDDGDGLIDEDYFTADGIDNDGDCPGDTNGDGIVCSWGDLGVDENIDGVYDIEYDAADNNGNGQIDEQWEYDYNGDGVNDWGELLDSDEKIIIYDGRRDSLINGEINPWYMVTSTHDNATNPRIDEHIRGDYIWSDDQFTILFDTYTQDYGLDGIPGDAHVDLPGDGQHDQGESLLNIGGVYAINDFGLDGIQSMDANGDGDYDDPGDIAPDFGEGDGIWQPGDGWVDNGNGVVDTPTESGGFVDSWQYTENEPGFNDVWPPADGIYNPDQGDYIAGDYGQDGIPNTNDPGEGNGILPMDTNEGDGDYDTGDGCYGCEGDITTEQFKAVTDTDGDGLSDAPDYEIDNRKVEARIDIDGVPFWGLDDLNLSFQSGYSWSKSQIVTGVGRYLIDGWEYTFNQFKANYRNWFFQTYVNNSYSGNTRGYILGDRIQDYSSNTAYQLQHNFKIKPILNGYISDTKVTWGIDYFKTKPVTNGTILNDGPNGRDEDGDGQIDEADEFDNTLAEEIGLYFQTTSKLSKRNNLELVTAARLDYMGALKNEGLQFGPKLGLLYNPNPKNSWRLTYGRAFNTPTTTSLYTNYYVYDFRIFNVFLRGNKDGTQYVRVDETTNVARPTYYDLDGNSHPLGNYNFEVDTNGDGIIDNNDTPYIDRIQDMPYFFLYQPTPGVPADWIPLDTSNYLVYIPEPNGDGHIIQPGDVKPGERYVPDIPSIRSEKINSFELGYKTMIYNMIISADFYVNHYSDFFSPATFITPTVIKRYNSDGSEATLDNFEFAGFIPGNQNNSNPPYGTGWNGVDDDGDWIVWASKFGWDQDDKNGDGDPRDPGEWGFVDHCTSSDGPNCEPRIFHPTQLQFDGYNISSIYQDPEDNIFGINSSTLDPVGIDEWSVTQGMGEFECDTYPCSSQSVEGRATSPPEIILGVLNYGNVWTQGMDVAFTQIFSPKLILTGNISWYNTTEFYNKLTRKKDPINAPKFKYNFNLNWDSKVGMVSIGFRHVDKFKWSDGIWAGNIGPYNLVDLHYKYKINNNLSASLSCLNLFNDIHNEIIGGAEMGRQIIMRFSTEF